MIADLLGTIGLALDTIGIVFMALIAVVTIIDLFTKGGRRW
jgi:hypothetical protein